MARTKATAKKNGGATARAVLAAQSKADKSEQQQQSGIVIDMKQKKSKKPHRFRPGTVALREIRRYQKSTECLIRYLPFVRLVREILGQHGEFRVKRSAFDALREMCEMMIVHLMNDTQIVAINSKRVTIQRADMALVLQILKNNGVDSFDDFNAQAAARTARSQAAAVAFQDEHIRRMKLLEQPLSVADADATTATTDDADGEQPITTTTTPAEPKKTSARKAAAAAKKTNASIRLEMKVAEE